MNGMADRVKNRADVKWAHPEVLEENAFLAPGSLESVLVNEGMSVEEKERERDNFREGFYQMMRPMFPDFWNEGYDEEYLSVDRGCLEEPDYAPPRVMVRIPKDIREGELLPCIFSVPAGGLVNCGTCETSAFLVPGMLDGTIRCVQVLSEYRLGGEYEYPAALNDLHATYAWMIRNAERFHVDTDDIVITGGSSGGYLALSLAFRLKRYDWCGAPMPHGLVIQTPMMDDTADTESFKYVFTDESGDELNWTRRTNIPATKMYLGDAWGDPALPPEAVPGNATLDDVRGLPPVWFPAQAEFDPGRDSVYRFAGLLHEAGIFCDLHMWGGGSHGTYSINATNLGQRYHMIQVGAMRDALTFDFRRPWLGQEEA